MTHLAKISEVTESNLASGEVDLLKGDFYYWRFRIFYSIFVGYVLFYFTRKSFTFVIPQMMEDLALNRAEIGAIGSALYLSYGLSKFASGVLADRVSPRYMMAAGLALTGVLNIFFGLSSSYAFLLVFWGLNGFFQGFGWPPCAKLLNHWFEKKERGSWWSLHSSSHNVGGALIPILVAWATFHYDWRMGMYLPGAIALLMSFWLFERIRDVPEKMGFSPLGDVLEAGAKVNLRQDNFFRLLWRDVFCNKGVWILAMSYFFVYIVRTAVNDWGAMYLIQKKGWDMLQASQAVMFFEIGGFIGCLAAGWASDRFFAGRRLPVMLYSVVLLISSLIFYFSVPGKHLAFEFTAFAWFGFLIFIPQVLVGLAASELVDKKAACSANGFAGCFAYLGAAVTGYPLGFIIDQYGWQGYFYALLACSILIFLILWPLSWRRAKIPGMQM